MQELQKNNKKLIDLIYSKQEFSEKELFDGFFQQRNGDVAIEGTLTIRDYLGELTDLGVLTVRMVNIQL